MEYSTSEIQINVSSTTDPSTEDSKIIYTTLIQPDLLIPNVKIYDEHGEETILFNQGELYRIKAYCKNQGEINASQVHVFFYLDNINDTKLIGEKHYDTISTYQKYPSVLWDTSDVDPTDHHLIIIVDKENSIHELDEYNNQYTIPISVHNTSPDKNASQLLITALYPNTHPGIKNEFITIFNPTNTSIDLSGWYITPTPMRTKTDQQKIIFPNGSRIDPRSYLTITQNASDYFMETGEIADFTFKDKDNTTVPLMHCTVNITFSNNGAAIALKNPYNHTVDLLTYGITLQQSSDWIGSYIPLPSTGEILRRRYEQTHYVDSNKLSDWTHLREYRIGQSNLPLKTFHCNGSITTFTSPDCSYDIIVQTLNNAQESICINLYECTHPYLCDAIINALKRNVTVSMFLEGSPIGGISDEERIFLNRVHSYGGNIRFIQGSTEQDIYARYTFNHAKYVIIDNKTVIVESCNWASTGIPTKNTYGNREWGIIIHNTSIASYFSSVFQQDWSPQQQDSISYTDRNITIPPSSYQNRYSYDGTYQPQFSSESYHGTFAITPVFSPDTSQEAIITMINKATASIYVEQLYIYTNWDNQPNPFVQALINKSVQGVDVRVIMNYNPSYESSNDACKKTKEYLEDKGVKVKFIYTNWSIFSNVHNKGVIVDNTSVLISSINWNENSVMRNREAGVIVTSEQIAHYYAQVFFNDWNLTESLSQPVYNSEQSFDENDNTIYIVSLFTMTFGLIARDWRKRKWT
jgi:phosphatidylserine/phosphatidylglycerophosphate/cardiolipin synthase-like enzyme